MRERAKHERESDKHERELSTRKSYSRERGKLSTKKRERRMHETED